MRTYHAPTMTGLHQQMIESLVLGTPEDLDVISSVDVQIHNVMGYADSMEWEFDFKDYWLTKSRWSMMVKQYLDPDELQAWIDLCSSQIGTKGRGIATLRTKVVKPRGGEATGHTNKRTRRWGSCMLTLTYKALPTPQITLHSRTSYLGYIGALDLSVAWMAARYLALEMGIDMNKISFMWYNEAIQWHNFKSMAWLLMNTDPEARAQYRRLLTKGKSKMTEAEAYILANSPALKGTRKWLSKVRVEDANSVTYGDMNYNTYRRIRRRWHTEVFGYEFAKTFEGYSVHKRGEKVGEPKEYFKAYGPLPSVRIHELDFSALKMPFGKRYGGDYVPGNDMDDEDDDE